MDDSDLRSQAALFQRTVEDQPLFGYAWFVLGELRERLGERDAAIAAFGRARDLDVSDCFGAGLRLARLGAAAATAMPEAYVRGVFDQYAARFDRDLIDNLSYRGPELLRAAIAPAGGAHFPRVLDLGCGTGLAGEMLRPLAGRLVGVDLAPAMVAMAEAKGCYDRLEVGEAVAWLAAGAGGEGTFDLIVAADMFVYLGDLAPVLSAVAAALAPGGLVAFTVETHAGAGVALGDKLRFAHGAGHVEAALAAAGLAAREMAAVSTRTEGGAAVPGLLAVAQRR